MSIEAAKPVEETPIETKPVGSIPEASVPTANGPVAETKAMEAPSTLTPTTDATPATNGVNKGETVVEATPASEGVLGYKAPGFLKQLYFSKHFFWFSDEPVPSDSLTTHLRVSHNDVVGQQHAAWARETGKGVLFYCKRAEDKAHPSGLILLHEVSNVTKEGTSVFSFKLGVHAHKFEATSSSERDSWVVAIEKQAEESRSLKDDVTGRDSYKKNLEEYAKSPAQVIATARSKSKGPRKSLDATNATTTPAATETKPEESLVAPVPAPVEEKKYARKERSQSRKRASIFGSILGKKDEKETEHEAKKEAKAEDKTEKKVEKDARAEDKAEKKAEKHAIKEDKKEEAAIKKEEAKTTHESSKATEAVEAAAVAAVPAAALAAADKKEERKEEKEEERSGTTTPTDKKAKRGSVFGSLFKKNVTSPTAEKSEKDVGPATPAKDDVPPVSETAPVLDTKPIENKPIDAADVTAPADAVAAGPTTTEPVEETTLATPIEDARTEPKAEQKIEKKGGFLASLLGKKDEIKEEKVTEPVNGTATTPAPIEATDGTTESPTTKEERPGVREKRRSSLFASLGTIRRQQKKENDTTEAGNETLATETNAEKSPREKSPLPSKIGGLFRKPSKAVKSGEHKNATSTATEPKTETPTVAEETSAFNETSAMEESMPATAIPESTDSKIVGDVVPDELHAPFHDAVTTVPSEVKASA